MLLTGKPKIREWIDEHSAELVVLGIGMAISFVISLAITGDFIEFAGRR